MDAAGILPVFLAARYGHIESVKLLLSVGFRPDIECYLDRGLAVSDFSDLLNSWTSTTYPALYCNVLHVLAFYGTKDISSSLLRR